MNRWCISISLLLPFLVACAPAATPVPTITPTVLPTTIPTATNTSTPEPTSTPAQTPTSMPAPPPISRVENLVYTDFYDPEAATWALLNVPHPEFDFSELEGTTVSVQINGVNHIVSGGEAISQSNEYGGILVDYDEDVFRGSDELNISVSVFSSQSSVIFQYDEVLPNYSSTGVVSIPLDEGYMSKDGPLVVYHLDDMLPGNDMKSSFNGISKLREFGLGHVIPGVGQGHGNAIDVGYLMLFGKEEPLYVIFNQPYSLELSEIIPSNTNCKTQEYKLRFNLPTSALVETPWIVYQTPLVLEFHHLIEVEQSIRECLQNENSCFIEKGTRLGFMGRNGEREDGTCGGEVHIAVYDLYGSPHKSNGLRLPFSMFLSPEETEWIIDEFFR